MEVRIGDLYACAEAIMAIGRQEMDLPSAERIGNFIDAFVTVMQGVDVRRTTLLERDFENDGERRKEFDALAAEKVELPEFSFKEFLFLRVSPDGLLSLKRAGLYA